MTQTDARPGHSRSDRSATILSAVIAAAAAILGGDFLTPGRRCRDGKRRAALEESGAPGRVPGLF